jgi:hypothetical protein
MRQYQRDLISTRMTSEWSATAWYWTDLSRPKTADVPYVLLTDNEFIAIPRLSFSLSTVITGSLDCQIIVPLSYRPASVQPAATALALAEQLTEILAMRNYGVGFWLYAARIPDIGNRDGYAQKNVSIEYRFSD